MKNGKALLVIGWLLSSMAYAQEIREITRKADVYSEKYTVLKADKQIKQGLYQRYFRGKLIEKGEYNQGQRVGPWEFYDMMEKLDQTYEYTTHQVLFSTLYNRPDSLQPAYTVIIGTDTTYSQLTKPPVPVGGQNQLFRTMVTNIHAVGMNKPSLVVVSYLVDETGKFGPVRIVRSSAESAKNEEALRVIKLYSALSWLPGELNGRKVTTISMQPVRFDY